MPEKQTQIKSEGHIVKMLFQNQGVKDKKFKLISELEVISLVT